MNWLFPPESSKYVTILRNPVDHFESTFNYYQLGRTFGFGTDPVNSLENFLERPLSFFNIFNNGYNKNRINFIRNLMMFDLGLSYRYFQNYTAVKNYINFLNKEFDLVMIMDYFDESLVLLKRLLCWEIDDILYVKLNERKDNEKATHLSGRVQDNIRRWNKADVLLFNYFNATFWKKVAREGSGFYEDLSAFRERRLKIQKLCFESRTKIERIWGNKYVKSYSTRNNLNSSVKMLCNNLIKSEDSYLDELREKHMAELAPEIREQTRIDDETSWDVAKDLGYRISS